MNTLKEHLLHLFPCEEELIDAFIADFNNNEEYTKAHENPIICFKELYKDTCIRDLKENFPKTDDKEIETYFNNCWNTNKNISSNLFDFGDFHEWE